jgi:transposase
MANDLSTSPTRAAGLVTVQLGADLKREWVQWCADRSLVPGKALRSLVERALADGLELATSRSGEVVRVVVAKQPDRGPKVGREVYFTPSENAAIEAVAKAQGFAFQEWVVAALAKAPSYGQAELEALTQSNAHMAQVAVDLAALRRQESAGEIADALGDLEGEIRQHVETVSAAMAQGAQRWQLKV